MTLQSRLEETEDHAKRPEPISRRKTAFDLPEAEDAILARCEDPDEQVSDDDEQEAALDIENEETEILEGSEEDFDEADLDDEEADPEEEDDEPDDQEEEDDEAEAELVDDDAEVEILVDGETHRASVKSLKRLFGVEKSLTRKSQHVAQQRKQAEDALQKTDAVLQAMLAKAEERYKPYADVDFLVASKTMDDADFAALRKEAQLKLTTTSASLKRGSRQFLWRNPEAAAGSPERGGCGSCGRFSRRTFPSGRTRCITTSEGTPLRKVCPRTRSIPSSTPVVIQILNKSRLYDQGKRVATSKESSDQEESPAFAKGAANR